MVGERRLSKERCSLHPHLATSVGFGRNEATAGLEQSSLPWCIDAESREHETGGAGSFAGVAAWQQLKGACVFCCWCREKMLRDDVQSAYPGAGGSAVNRGKAGNGNVENVVG